MPNPSRSVVVSSSGEASFPCVPSVVGRLAFAPIVLGLLVGAAAQLVHGCAGPSRTEAARAESVVKPEDLPERHRRVLEAWKKGGAAWEIEREAVRADPELSRFVVDNLMVEMVQAFERSRIAGPGRAPGPFERAQNELVEMREHSTAFLAEFLPVRDGIVSFLAAQTLERIGAPAVPVVAKVLDDERPESRRRAAELLGRLPVDAAVEPAVLESLGRRAEKDDEWIVRAQSARTLGLRAARLPQKGFALGVLLRVALDEDASVATAGAGALGDLGEVRGIPRIAELLPRAGAAGRPGVVDALQASLARLSGDTTRRDAAGWRAWWRENEARLAPPVPLAPR